MSHIIQETFSEGGWLRLNKTIGRELGLEASVMLGNLVDKSVYFDSDIFFMTREHIEFETTLTPHLQRKGEKKLEEAGLIIVRPGSHPTQLRRINYYGINLDNIHEFLMDNKRTLADKKRERQEFYAQCLEDLQSLKSSTTACEIDEQLHVKEIDSNKNKLIRTNKYTTRDEKEVEASTKVEGVELNTTDLDEEIIAAYKKEVDALYIEQPADVKYVHNFKNKEQLLKYIPYWNKYIGHHPDMQWRLNTLDDYDKKHSARICVMIKHWNKFRKFAEGQIVKEQRMAEGLV